jgi:hypothetical protein
MAKNYAGIRGNQRYEEKLKKKEQVPWIYHLKE